MLKNFLIMAFRNIKKQRGYSLINIVGLSIGIASCLLIISYVHHELSYESMHSLKDDIYRVYGKVPFGDDILNNGVVASPLAPGVQAEIPEVVDSLRLVRFYNKPVQINNRTFIEKTGFYSENNYFKFFNAKLIHGDPSSALQEPFTAVLNQTLAQKYFGEENPLGKTLRITVGKTYDFKVTGLMKDLPSNTVVNRPILLSFATLKQTQPESINRWEGWGWVSSFVQLKTGANPDAVEKKITALAVSHLPEDSKKVTFFLQKLENIYFDNQRLSMNNGLDSSGDITRIYIFSLIAFLILMVAVINFINLSTARITNRIKEVGIYKTCGANKNHLVWRFLSESFLLTAAAMGIAMFLFFQLKPHLDQYLGKTLTLDFFQTPLFFISISLMIFVIGILSGAYPAFYLSRFKIAEILSNRLFRKSSKSRMRWVLVGTQFFIAIALIFSTIVVNKQVKFSEVKDLGYDTKNLLLLKNWSSNRLENTEIIKREILNRTDARLVSKVSKFPYGQNRGMGDYKKNNNQDEKGKFFQTLFVDPDFIRTMGLTLLSGRGFGNNINGNEKSVLINERAQEKFGFKNPIGKYIYTGKNRLTVIGVLKDWNTNSIHSKIFPLVIHTTDESARHLLIRFENDSKKSIISQIKNVWSRICPDEIFDCNFLESVVLGSYMQDKRLANLLISFCQLIVIIAGLGIVGLASYSIEQRRKEIGIRKVMGASVSKITLLLTGAYAKSVLLAGVFALPLGYFGVKQWLSTFAFQTPIGIETFLAAIIIVLILSMLSVIFHTVRAAASNPIESLRRE